MEQKKENAFVGYEYKEVVVPSELVSWYIDSYESFGWMLNENLTCSQGYHLATIRMKRNRKIINKMELTRLQRHFEACANEIKVLERTKRTVATIWAIVVGIVGSAFMAGSVFAIVHQPPIYWLCILLAVPAFLGWIAPLFIYRYTIKSQTRKIQPMIEAKLEEIYEICEKGQSLL